jgi:hypothetical protein
MRRCHYCQWGHPQHAEACPQSDKAKQALWRKGWDEGYLGLESPSNNDPTFRLGFGQGVVALEEAQNGCDIY